MYSTVINLRLPSDLIKAVDEAAKANYNSRSGFIREAIILRLKGQHIVDQKNPEDELQALIDEALTNSA